jgi:hypothetical protein
MGVRGFELAAAGDVGGTDGRPALAALQQAIPLTAIHTAIALTGAREQRRRRLPSDLVVALVIGLGLWARASLREVLAALVDGLRSQDPAAYAAWRAPAKSALTKARQRVGPWPLRVLFHHLAGPVAEATTPGAFLCGRRLMAIDGTTLALPDTPENAHLFGRPTTNHGTGEFTTTAGAFPQVRVVALIESGTHVLCDAVLRPFFRGEAPAARQLLRSVGPGMLVMWDCGLHSYEMVRSTQARGADFLGRVGKAIVLAPEEVLADGSYLATVYPSPTARRQRRAGIAVRVIAYTIADPARPGHGECYRLITSLLDPTTAPAHELAVAYHERWEVETTIGEIKTHLADRRPAPQVRSRRPREVVQEVYGLLLAHLALRRLMAAAAATADLDPDRLSFSGTLRIVRRAIPRFQQAADCPQLTPLCSPAC